MIRCFQRDRLCLHLSKRLQDLYREIPSLAARVHLAGEPHDLVEPAHAAVLPSSHRLTDEGEELEVLLLARQKRVTTEVRKDPIEDREETANLPLQRLVASIRMDRAAAEELLQQSQDLCPIAVLADREAWPDLPADQQCRSGRKRNVEATFSVDVPGDVRRQVHSLLRARVLHRP
jgi:hypothetical protein